MMLNTAATLRGFEEELMAARRKITVSREQTACGTLAGICGVEATGVSLPAATSGNRLADADSLGPSIEMVGVRLPVTRV